jgi:two-component system response regulator
MVGNESVVDLRLAEDSPDDAELAIYGLKKHNPANRPDWVNDGGAAPDCLFHRGVYVNSSNSLPRVVLLDPRLPKVDRIEMLTQIRANPDTRELPVGVLTSFKEAQDLMLTYKLGVSSFVTKPIALTYGAEDAADLGTCWVLVNRVPPEIRPG